MAKNSGNWVVSGAISAILHAVVIGVLLCSSSPAENEAPAETQEEKGSAETQPSSAPSEQFDDDKLRRIKEMVGEAPAAEVASREVKTPEKKQSAPSGDGSVKPKESSSGKTESGDGAPKVAVKQHPATIDNGSGVYVYRVKQGDTLSLTCLYADYDALRQHNRRIGKAEQKAYFAVGEALGRAANQDAAAGDGLRK